MNQLRDAIAAGENNGKIRIKMDELDFAANKWLKPYPNAVWRENVEVILVAVAVAMAIRTFFVQPFKIPTGSMQPTLYGVTSVPDFSRFSYQISRGEIQDRFLPQCKEQLKLQHSLAIPTGWERIKEWFEGISYIHIVANTDGELQAVEPPVRFLIFNIKQTIWIGGQSADNLVSARLWRANPANARRIADPRGFWRRAKISKGPGRGENARWPPAIICLWTG